MLKPYLFINKLVFMPIHASIAHYSTMQSLKHDIQSLTERNQELMDSEDKDVQPLNAEDLFDAEVLVKGLL